MLHWPVLAPPVVFPLPIGVALLPEQLSEPPIAFMSMVLAPGGVLLTSDIDPPMRAPSTSVNPRLFWMAADPAIVRLEQEGEPTSAKLEERFGYVKGEEHTLTTRAGFLVSF